MDDKTWARLRLINRVNIWATRLSWTVFGLIGLTALGFTLFGQPMIGAGLILLNTVVYRLARWDPDLVVIGDYDEGDNAI